MPIRVSGSTWNALIANESAYPTTNMLIRLAAESGQFEN